MKISTTNLVSTQCSISFESENHAENYQLEALKEKFKNLNFNTYDWENEKGRGFGVKIFIQ